ncbi:MAG: CpsB/CapC family capsule biosynthesis tyrosine phosphatase [Acutalibacteraceae bacterium]|nr:CpsB/CapC family capsule biosynthesis tyrosine phosphatase [Acutalibacteraceae bacterium]
MKKYDMHSHILHNIDDGPRDIDVSLLLLNQLWLDGVTHLMVTPHFYTNDSRMNPNIVAGFLEHRNRQYNKLISEYKGTIKIKLGCELHLTPGVFSANDISDFCYQDTNYLLTEMPYGCQFKEDDLAMIKRTIQQYNVVPVLAHIERYPSLFNNKKLITKVIDMGCMVQLNTQCLTKILMRKKAFNLINNGYVHLLGSDMHSTMRGCDYGKGMEMLSYYCDNEAVEKIMNNAEKIFGE